VWIATLSGVPEEALGGGEQWPDHSLLPVSSDERSYLFQHRLSRHTHTGIRIEYRGGRSFWQVAGASWLQSLLHAEWP